LPSFHSFKDGQDFIEFFVSSHKQSFDRGKGRFEDQLSGRVRFQYPGWISVSEMQENSPIRLRTCPTSVILLRRELQIEEIRLWEPTS
jgi:hypothetical protein